MALMNSVFYVTSLLILAGYVQCDGDNGGGGHITVMISFASLNPCALEFFKTQLTPEVVDEFKQCSDVVHLDVMPCATSSLVMNKLTCWGCDAECKDELIETCAKMAFKGDNFGYAKAAACMMGGGDTKTCVGDKYNSVENCKTTPEAGKKCQEYWDTANMQVQMTDIIGIKYDKDYVEETSVAARQDFKGITCAKLKEKNLQCCACN